MDLLPNDLLNRVRERAPKYDELNSFFEEDFQELKESGYLRAIVPAEFGGGGLTLSETVRHQRKLAMHSGATALGVNMHLLWGAVARILYKAGDKRLEWVFEDIVKGEVFAFGISEAGNDYILLDSFTTAEESGDSYLLTGKKIYTTLSPVWTRLGLHAKTAEENPSIVAGFIKRENVLETVSYPDVWNPLGMRATQSFNTKLEKAKLLKSDTVSKYEPFNAADPMILAVSQAFAVLTSSVYAGLADRALELSRAAVKTADPDHLSKLTRAIVDHSGSLDSLELLARDIDEGVSRSDWAIALATLKNRVTDEARQAVDVAFRILGARGYQADSELARIYRDVMAGMFHPRNSKSLAAGVRADIEAEQQRQ